MFKQLLIACLLLPALSAQAEGIPAEMHATWTQFQEALRQDSPKKLAVISKFPIHSNEFGGTIMSPKILKARFKTIFTPKTKQCLLSTQIKPESDGKEIYYEAFCDNDIYPIRYIFELVGAKFLFVGIDNINE
jgi:hypothetical protein